MPTSTPARFDQVPVHLVICVELETLAVTDAELDRTSIVGGASIYPFVHNILLGLRHEGLGAAFTTLLVPAEPELRTLLSIPDGVAVAGHIALGHRADPWPRQLSRKPVAEFAFADRYGRALDRLTPGSDRRAQLPPGADAELAVDVARVGADGLDPDVERGGDLGVGAAALQQLEHVGLAGGERRRAGGLGGRLSGRGSTCSPREAR